MAACLITISGTSGLLRLDYKISSVAYSIETGIGTFYIEDTATDVTYTTLSGDVVASSGCLTITPVPSSCYTILWKNIKATGYTIDAIILGTEVITIPDTGFPNPGKTLVDSVNNLQDDRVKIVGYKVEYLNPTNTAADASYNSYYIFKILGSETPILRVRNADSSGYIYLHGESSACTILGYEAITPCYDNK